ncbi:MAG: flagellar hook-length control protein FliK [Hyphomicrobium sp.]
MDAGATGALLGAPSGSMLGEPRAKPSNGSGARQDELWAIAIAGERIAIDRPSVSSSGSVIAAIRNFIAGADGTSVLAGNAVDAEGPNASSREAEVEDVPDHDRCSTEDILLSTLVAAAEVGPPPSSPIHFAPASSAADTARLPLEAAVRPTADVHPWGGRVPMTAALRTFDVAEDERFETVVTVKTLETHRLLSTVAPDPVGVAAAVEDGGAVLVAEKSSGVISGLVPSAGQPSASERSSDRVVAAEAMAISPDLAQSSSTEPGRGIGKSQRADASTGRSLTSEPPATLDASDGRSRAYVNAKVTGVEAGSGTRTDGASASSGMADRDRPQQPPQVMAQLEGALLRALTQLADGGKSASAEGGGSSEMAAGWRSEAIMMKQLVIELEPADLGRVSVRIRLTGGELELAFRTDLASTRVLIEEQIGDLGDRLGSAGYAVEAISISAAGDRSERTGDAPDQREPQSQWLGREPGSGDTGGRRSQAHGHQQSSNLPFGGSGSGADDSQHVEPPPVRIDGVFV